MNFAIVFLLLTFFYNNVFANNCYQHKYRLSGNIKPSFYSLKIHPNLEKEIFSGEISIHVKIEQEVKFIEFHSCGLEINSFTFNNKQVFNCFCNCFNFYYYHNGDLIHLERQYEKLFPPGNHVIRIKYQGQFSKTTTGLFKANFTKNGTVTHLVATDFEPSSARKVFPCFDEPKYKAPIKLTLVVPDVTYIPISNMRKMSAFQAPEGFYYKFETSPPMSTYLLSFVITNNYIFEEFNNKIKYGAYYLKTSDSENDNKTNLLKFASQVIDFYTEYTNMTYPLPKIDFVEFDREESTATENWGLITLKTGLLSQQEDSFEDFQKVTVIAHELAHFWFGNLVTNEWWDDIWLQEAFATFMSVKAEERILKNDANLNFASTYLEELYWFEREKKSSPVVTYEEVPGVIRETFNDVTYNKGAAILRMLEQVLGEENFRNGVITYIKKYAFKTATTTDFLSIFEGVEIREFLESYLYQNGYPVIFVDEEEDRYVLRQKGLGHNSHFDYKWTIPVTYVTDNRNVTNFWFDKDIDKFEMKKGDEKWITFNYHQIGYYRVHYSQSLLEKISNHTEELETHERDSLLLELVSLFESNLLSCDVPIKYLQKLASAEDFNAKNAYIAYLKLGKIKQFDKNAFEKLWEIFHDVFSKAGKERQLSRESVLDAEKIELTAQIELCINWLKSPEVLNL